MYLYTVSRAQKNLRPGARILLAPALVPAHPTHMSEDDAAAAAQELEALQAIYGDDAGDAPVRLEIASPSEWRFRLGADAILEVFVPRDYPSLQAPTPVLHAPRLGDRASALVDQLHGALAHAPPERVAPWSQHAFEGVVHVVQPPVPGGHGDLLQLTRAAATAMCASGVVHRDPAMAGGAACDWRVKRRMGRPTDRGRTRARGARDSSPKLASCVRVAYACFFSAGAALRKVAQACMIVKIGNRMFSSLVP